MLVVPWQHVANWKCNACGLCCKTYSVVLNFPEWLRIVKNYGVEKTVSDLNKLYLNRRDDGSCVFLYSFSNANLCGIQQTKPKACKLWPSRITSKPEFGYARDALYSYGKNRLYIYADSACSGLRLGKPTLEFTAHTLKEFIEIALGFRTGQYKTTANIDFLQLWT